METRLRPMAFGIATAITSALLSALCALGFVFWPDATLGFFTAFMHGLDLTAVRSLAPLNLARVIYGVVGLGVVGLLTGAVLASIYNAVPKR